MKTESTESAITMSTEELWANAWGSGFRVKGFRINTLKMGVSENRGP